MLGIEKLKIIKNDKNKNDTETVNDPDENKLKKRQAELISLSIKKARNNEELSPEDTIEVQALREFANGENARGVELAIKEKTNKLNPEEEAELTGFRKFPGNIRMASLCTKDILGTLTETEAEEYALSKNFYWDEAGGGKPSKTNPDGYARLEELKNKNLDDKKL